MLIVFLTIGIKFQIKRTVEKACIIRIIHKKPFSGVCKNVHKI